MIDIRQLTKRYGSTLAVDRLDLTVEPGRVTGFLGPNGAGKTTTLRILLGLARADSGQALIGGHRYRDLRTPLRTVGSLLDAGAAHPARTGRQHLTWLARSNAIPQVRVGEVLDQVGLTAAADRRIGGYSLGMNQRLGLAGALLGDPPLLVLDEPVNGLDAEGIIWIRQLLRGLAAEGRTVLISSHLMSEMAQTADHLVVIASGRLLADVPTRRLIEQSAQCVVVASCTEPDRLLAALTEEGHTATLTPGGVVEIVDTPVADIGTLAARRGLVLLGLAQRTGSLEDAYLGLTARSQVEPAGLAGASAATSSRGEQS